MAARGGLAEALAEPAGPVRRSRHGNIELADCACGEPIWRGRGWDWEHIDTDAAECAVPRDQATAPEEASPLPSRTLPGGLVMLSYSVATTAAGGTLHVLRDGSATALCGAGPARFVGEVGQPYDEDWPWCRPCALKAGADVMYGWMGGRRRAAETLAGWRREVEEAATARADRRARLREAADPPRRDTPVVRSAEPLSEEENHGPRDAPG